MKYFLHDSNSFSDESITALFLAHGYEGLGLFYTILERFAYHEKPILEGVLKEQIKFKRRHLKIWDDLLKFGLISINNGEVFNRNLLDYSTNYEVKSEKNRERITRWRNKNKGATEKRIVNTGGASKSIATDLPDDLPPSLDTPEFREAWGQWQMHRKQKRQKLTAMTVAKQLKFLATQPNPVAVIDQSIEKGWTGLFELKSNGKDRSASSFERRMSYDHAESERSIEQFIDKLTSASVPVA